MVGRKSRFDNFFAILVVTACILLDVFPPILFRLVVMPAAAILVAWEVYQFELPLPIEVLAVAVAVWLLASSLHDEWRKAKRREREDAMVVCYEPEEEALEIVGE